MVPGYKGHLVGGVIAFSATCTILLVFDPTIIAKIKCTLLSMMPLLGKKLIPMKFSTPLLVTKAQHSMASAIPGFLVILEWFLFALAGSLFPDIDIKSKGQKWLYWILFFMFIILIMRNRIEVVAILGVVALLPMLVKHRGLFHKFWFNIAVPCAVWWIVSALYPMFMYPLFFNLLFFTAGAISHLWLDMGLRRMFRL